MLGRVRNTPLEYSNSQDKTCFDLIYNEKFLKTLKFKPFSVKQYLLL